MPEDVSTPERKTYTYLRAQTTLSSPCPSDYLRNRLVIIAADPRNITLHQKLRTLATAQDASTTVQDYINSTKIPPLTLNELVEDLLLDYQTSRQILTDQDIQLWVAGPWVRTKWSD